MLFPRSKLVPSVACAVVLLFSNLPATGANAAGRPDLCVGVRGNGPRIWAHFTSLARVTEEFGQIDGAAGGSSGSLTVFLFESVRANPLVGDCGAKRCNRRERAAREALLFKAIQGLQDAGLIDDVMTLAAVVGAVQQGDLEALLANPETADEGRRALIAILSDPALQAIINPELIDLLLTSPNPLFHARDIAAALQNAASFNVTDPNVFVRPGLINFASVAELVGRLGSFLAAYAPTDRGRLASFLDACASAGSGLDWPDVAALAAPGGTCGDLFTSLFDDYKAALTPISPSRLDEPIGRHAPALVTTSVLQGPAVAAFQAAKATYFNAQLIDDLGVDWQDVRFGYWAGALDLARVGVVLPIRFQDAKSAKFTPISESPWREILGFSPAEPGLARALELADGRVSAGGWTDPVPTQVLAALGCRDVILINRRDGIGTFTTSVATQLGAQPSDLDALYELTDPNSGFTTALRRASGVWCTDWDAPDTLDVRGLSAEGWEPPLETRDRRLLSYERAGSDLGIPGCTPLVGP